MKIDYALMGAMGLSSVSANSLVMQIIMENLEASDNVNYNHPELRPASVKKEPTSCENGVASVDGEDFTCENVDFLSFVAFEEMEITIRPHRIRASMADVWGWYSEATGREITLASMDNGFTALDTTDPLDPCILAKFPSQLRDDIWADVKVVNDVVFHVKDSREGDNQTTQNTGMEVYDLFKLDSVDCKVEGYEPIYIFPDYITFEHGRAHNVIANQQTNRIYSCGAQICNGGLVAYSVEGEYRLRPKFLGCVEADGYSHDAQCVVYTGPDTRFTGQEICFGFNEDTLTVWDVTDMDDGSEPILVSRTPYNNSAYSHQGWLNREMTKVLLDDELDELCNENINASRRCTLTGFNLDGTLTTTTNIFDVTDLTAPFKEGIFSHNDPSIDHNLYVWGAIHEVGMGGNKALNNFPDPNFAYLNNYQAGLKIIDMSNPNALEWTDAGFFDVTPEETGLNFLGAWSGYMHPSGVYALTCIERGLFLLQPNMAYTEEFPPGSNDGGSSDGDDEIDLTNVLVVLIGLLVAVIIALSAAVLKKGSAATVAETKAAGPTQTDPARPRTLL